MIAMPPLMTFAGLKLPTFPLPSLRKFKRKDWYDDNEWERVQRFYLFKQWCSTRGIHPISYDDDHEIRISEEFYSCDGDSGKVTGIKFDPINTRLPMEILCATFPGTIEHDGRMFYRPARRFVWRANGKHEAMPSGLIDFDDYSDHIDSLRPACLFDGSLQAEERAAAWVKQNAIEEKTEWSDYWAQRKNPPEPPAPASPVTSTLPTPPTAPVTSTPTLPKASTNTARSAPAGDYTRTVKLIRGSDIRPEAISWLWNGWLAAGKMHVLGGAPGTGKTTLSMAFAATVTTGGRWPDGCGSPVGSVVIWSGEDDPSDTLIPRLILSGADLSRVFFIADVLEGGERRSFDPARDMDALRHKLAEISDVRLLIVDPIVSAVMGDSHKNAEVRRSLQPLADLAASMRCALLGITHFSKGTSGRDPVERLTGSLAFGALARVVLVAAKQQEKAADGQTARIFLRAKSNIGPDDGGFTYDLQQGELKTHPGIFASSVQWGAAIEGAARELLATADATDDDGEGGAQAQAQRFLSDLLADGPVSSKTIRSDAEGAGYSWRTIQRAQQALGIEAVKDGMKGGWTWRLPPKNAN